MVQPMHQVALLTGSRRLNAADWAQHLPEAWRGVIRGDASLSTQVLQASLTAQLLAQAGVRAVARSWQAPAAPEQTGVAAEALLPLWAAFAALDGEARSGWQCLWLHSLTATQQVLPSLGWHPLAAALRQPEWLERLAPLAGHSAAWLAAQVPALSMLQPWTCPQGAAQEALWQQGRLPERQALLLRWRLHDPVQALQALRDLWPSLKATQQEALLAVLACAPDPVPETETAWLRELSGQTGPVAAMALRLRVQRGDADAAQALFRLLDELLAQRNTQRVQLDLTRLASGLAQGHWPLSTGRLRVLGRNKTPVEQQALVLADVFAMLPVAGLLAHWQLSLSELVALLQQAEPDHPPVWAGLLRALRWQPWLRGDDEVLEALPRLTEPQEQGVFAQCLSDAAWQAWATRQVQEVLASQQATYADRLRSPVGYSWQQDQQKRLQRRALWQRLSREAQVGRLDPDHTRQLRDALQQGIVSWRQHQPADATPSGGHAETLQHWQADLLNVQQWLWLYGEADTLLAVDAGAWLPDDALAWRRSLHRHSPLPSLRPEQHPAQQHEQRLQPYWALQRELLAAGLTR